MAKGAHRLQITLTLAKKTTRLIQILFNLHKYREVSYCCNGRQTEYSFLSEFARRTFDESGNYTVRPFQISVEESVTVNENVGRFVGATTNDGNTASSDLLAVKVSSGKAYVNGYEIEKDGFTIKDINKVKRL